MKDRSKNILEAFGGIILIFLIVMALRHKEDIRLMITGEALPVTAETQESPEAGQPEAEPEKQPAAAEEEEPEPDPTEAVEEEEPVLPKEPKEEPGSVELAFGGDVLLSGYLLGRYDSKGITGLMARELLDELDEADIAMVNQEFPFSSRGTAMTDKQFTFRIEPERVKVLQELGIDIVTLANNHSLDYGTEALLDTFDTLDGAGIQYAGAGHNGEEARTLKTFDIEGKKIGILAASRVIPVPEWTAGKNPGLFTTYDPTALVEAIKAADAECDVVFVYVHWGVERAEQPETYQKELVRKYIDAGADMIIGAHPHVLQGIEYYKGKPVVYSLGNFIFGSQIPKTVMLKVEVAQDNTLIPRVVACSTNAEYVLTKSEKPEDIYSHIAGLSVNAQIDENGVVSEAE